MNSAKLHGTKINTEIHLHFCAVIGSVWKGNSENDHIYKYIRENKLLRFPGGSDGKESACNAGDLSLIPGLGRSPGGGNGHPHQYSGLENPHGQRSMAGYSPWGCKESDMTEQLSTALSS